MHTVGTWWMWIVFFVFVLGVISIDLFLMGARKPQRVSIKEAGLWTLTWFVCAMVFNLFLWLYLTYYVDPILANKKALEFFTGYLIEESLSVDNMFVFLMIFNYFSVPSKYQRRVLMYGVLGALILRLMMILLGAWLISYFHWLLYVFGAFLIYSGVKMLMVEEKKDFQQTFLVKWVRKFFNITEKFYKEQFFVRQNNVLFMTPLFLVLILIELSDLLFALDSIPAIFAITQDPFIVFTSNIFAILGLRALYFLVENMADRFYLLKYGITIMLIFIGSKMILSYWFEIPILISLSVIVAILTTSITLSALIQSRKKGKQNLWKY